MQRKNTYKYTCWYVCFQLKMPGMRAFPLLLYVCLLNFGFRSCDSAYTFLQRGQSYLEYRPEWMNIKQLGIEFSFRTLQPNAFLLHHTFLEAEGIYKPELWVELKKGALEIVHHYSDFRESLTVAKGMYLKECAQMLVTASN